jgi:hypothetical protein
MFSIGLHWVVLQSAAWAGMIVSYSVREGSLVTGLSQTFDAEHPCALCDAVAFGMKQEKKDSRQKQEPQKKLLLAIVILERPFIAVPPSQNSKVEMMKMFAPERDLRPPFPPPRRGVA